MIEQEPLSEEEAAERRATWDAIHHAVQAFEADRTPATYEALLPACGSMMLPHEALQAACVPVPDDAEYAAWALAAAAAGDGRTARTYVERIGNGRKKGSTKNQVTKVLDGLAQKGAAAPRTEGYVRPIRKAVSLNGGVPSAIELDAARAAQALGGYEDDIAAD